VIESYPGHSGTDMIVRVPNRTLSIRAICCFQHVSGLLRHTSTVSGWRQTLKTFASWDKDTLFVPDMDRFGSGRDCALAVLFDDIEEQAQKMHKAGVPAAEAADLYVVPKNTRTSPFFAWDFSIGPTIRSCMRVGSQVAAPAPPLGRCSRSLDASPEERSRSCE